MSVYDRMGESDNARRQSDYRHSDYRNRSNMSSRSQQDFEQRDRNRADRYAGERFARNDERTQYGSDRDRSYRRDNDDDRNMWTRSIDEVRSWFGDEEAERRRMRDEEERMRSERRSDSYESYGRRSDVRDSHDRFANSNSYQQSNRNQGWDSSRGYGSNIDSDYGRSSERDRSRSGRYQRDNDRFFSSSNEYGGSRNRDYYRDYPTHNQGRSRWNTEGDEMNYSHLNSSSNTDQANSSGNERLFGGRDYERNYPTRAERNDNADHDHDFSGGWQSSDSYRGYRSLNNTGRVGIDQDNVLGRQRDNSPNPSDQNYSRGDYHVNLNAGGQEYNSRHYEQRGRMGTPINEFAQRGYSQGYGRTGYSTNQPGNYANAEVPSAKHPKNYKGADERIYVEVCEALGRELDASNIEVTASNSEITLSGTVRNRDEKRRAERIAERVHGVEDVHNQLTVKEETSNASANSSTTETRSASQPGNSSRTDLAADGSSQGDGGGSNGSASNGSSGNGSANGNGRSSSSSSTGRSGARK